MKGTVTNVNIGPLVIEGLLMEDGTFGIAQQQVAAIFSVIPTSAPKWLKSILGEGFQRFQVTTNRNEGTNQNRKENVIPIAEFERLLFEMALRGDARAIRMSRALIGLSLTQLLSDAFGLKFEKEERQEWVDKRLKGKATRRTHTDAIMEWGIRTTGQKPDGKVYADITNGIYIYCFRKTAAELKAEKGVKKGQLLRDFFNPKELSQVEALEQVIMMAVDRGANPYAALAKLSL
jgi:hypothetical protein